MRLARPKNTVVAEDVEQGKPDPQCYLLGRKKLGLSPSARMLVLEDAPSGVRAGKAAGFTVVALATTHEICRLQEAGADLIVRDLDSVKLEQWDPRRKEAAVVVSNILRT